jgi:hypothetical protein
MAFQSQNGLGFDYGRQIIVDRRNKTSICFLNHLEPASVANWSQMHASGEFKKGRKRYSRIKVLGQDYSKGTGADSVYCSYNLDPADIKNIRNIVDMRYNEYKTNFYKVMGDDNKPAPFRRLTISRNPGMNNPWCIEITNGMAKNKKPIPNSTKTVKQYFDENNFYKMIATVDTFVTLWEYTFVTKLIDKGTRRAYPLIEQSINYNNSNNNNFTGNGYR